jgi:beta-galactosidase
MQMKKPMRVVVFVVINAFLITVGLRSVEAQQSKGTAAQTGRERLLMDFGWRFAFGHPYNTEKDFNHAIGYFSYITKAGYGDGAAAANFDDRGWRTLDLPHDWAVEMPFAGNASHSHGYKTIGRKFPETSVGWYRKSFFIPETDLGRRISVEFDGVFRDSVVWVNGHYLGREPSGYNSFSRDVTDYLRYGENNVIAVRVDATIEEGWFYEGAGIYRHVWLVKTNPLHVARYGTFVTSDVKDNASVVTARTTVVNDGTAQSEFDIDQAIVDAGGKTVATGQEKGVLLTPGDSKELSCQINVPNPALWSIESPNMYKLVTTINSGGSAVDRYETPFGIRTIRFDPNEGFFLNGKRVELLGTNNHQDHAGVGVAIPDALQDFRIARLKAMGSNAYRCSHNPATPELLDACDRLGMLVLDENRLMGSNAEHLELLKQMILRDRNHPSVIAWSLGNEEWGIEGNITGARITSTMQAFAKRLDPTRGITVAISGGWGNGISTVVDIMGYNYISHGNTDQQHAKFPNQSGMGTEESSVRGTRGIYFDDRTNAHMAPVLNQPGGAESAAGNMEKGWQYYVQRPYLAGLFYWTGFDHRGESKPFDFPAVSSQPGILDTCGFPKDSFYYLKSWWTDKSVLYIYPHWNLPGKEGMDLNVMCYSNCDEVEIILNGQSLGKKTMSKDSHLEWTVKYQPGALEAHGYKNGQKVATYTVATTGEPADVQLTPDRASIKADGEDVSVITVQVNDAQGRIVPTAGNEITFTLQGPGKIIGVGNGDPSSHEPDRFFDTVSSLPITAWKMLEVDDAENRPEVAADFDDSKWQTAFARPEGGSRRPRTEAAPTGKPTVYRGVFDLPESKSQTLISLSLRSLGEKQSVYVNGKPIAENVGRNAAGQEFTLDPALLRPGKNVVAVVATPIEGGRRPGGQRDGGNAAGPGLIRITNLAGNWKRNVFNGLAQVIVQSTKEPGEITLTAASKGLSQAELKIQSQSSTPRPAVPATTSDKPDP